MEFTFSPHERIANILYVLDQLQDRLHCSSNEMERNPWLKAIDRILMELDRAVIEMKGTSAATYSVTFPDETDKQYRETGI